MACYGHGPEGRVTRADACGACSGRGVRPDRGQLRDVRYAGPAGFDGVRQLEELQSQQRFLASANLIGFDSAVNQNDAEIASFRVIIL